jgi:hypothetical protein
MMNKETWPTSTAIPVPNLVEGTGGAPEEVESLMSLALDSQLSEAELDLLLGQIEADDHWATAWQTWQEVDNLLQQAPSVAAPASFVANFERRLVQAERRQHLRVGALIVTAAVLLWGSALIAAVSLGAVVVTRQGAWLSDLIHTTAYWWAGFVSGAGALRNLLGTLVATPEALALGLGYAALSLMVLALWVRFLRRSTVVQDVVTA